MALGGATALLCTTAVAAAKTATVDALPPNLLKLPEAFAFGAATAAYQIEGAAQEGGRGPSIWDSFSHEKGKTHNGDSGDVADDHYHRYPEDIELLTKAGIKHYRLSLSWSRLMPDGRTLNEEGVAFYSALLDLLVEKNIEPRVTLYHWDLPLTLEQEYHGWLSPQIVEDFSAYADACFELFGHQVKTWTTFNEPLTFVGGGYGTGVMAPGRCSDRTRCPEGDSETEPLLAAHHVLLAHAHAASRFRARFSTGYSIDMVNCGWMAWPLREGSVDDANAASSFMEAQWAWFLDPLVRGDYPQSLKARAPALPQFTHEEQQLLKGSVDMLGVNYYTSRYVAAADAVYPAASVGDAAGIPALNNEYHLATQRQPSEGDPKIGVVGGSPWLYVAPDGLTDVLLWLHERYNLPLAVTENGCDQPSGEDEHDDAWRIDYLRTHIDGVATAIQRGADVRAYYAWSLLDNYEWADGYSKRFGLVFVDYASLTRTPKRSFAWYARLINAHASSSLLLVDDVAPGRDLKMVRAVSAVLLFLLCVVIVSRLIPKRRRLQAPRYIEISEVNTLPNVESGVEVF